MSGIDCAEMALRIDELEFELRELRSQLAQEEMNGMSIMECRDYIERELGVTAAMIPGYGASPFFDDLIKCIVNKVKIMITPSLLQSVWVTTTNGTTYVPLSALVSAIQFNQNGHVVTQTCVSTALSMVTTAATATTATNIYQSPATTNQTALASLSAGYPPAPEFEDGTMTYRPQLGRPLKLKMADGTVIDVDPDGSFRVVDKDAKVTYRASRMRDFNRYMNASDLLEEFVRFCGEQGVTQGEFMAMPVKVFIAWLVVRAAEADGEPPPEPIPALPDLRRPRCQACKRFIPRKLALRRIEVCGAVCLERIAV